MKNSSKWLTEGLLLSIALLFSCANGSSNDDTLNKNETTENKSTVTNTVENTTTETNPIALALFGNSYVLTKGTITYKLKLQALC